jgi:hypothetical protein
MLDLLIGGALALFGGGGKKQEEAPPKVKRSLELVPEQTRQLLAEDRQKILVTENQLMNGLYPALARTVADSAS